VSRTMNKSKATEFLTKVMVKLRHDRPPLGRDQPWYVRYDKAMGGTFAQLWFLTRGCTWDRRGACTMCNYGQSAGVSPLEITRFVREGLESIDRPISELYVSPSGSLLDELEVPAASRRDILRLVDEFPAERFSFETRPETITASVIDELHDLVPSKGIAVGFGLESADSWILDHCVNKSGASDAFAAATTQLHGINLYANVSLGSALLSTAEAIEDTVKSVEWALGHGANLALVFPMHVKGYTLLDWLYQRGLYAPPSLWSLVEVLRRLDPSLITRVTISWYRSDYGADPGVIASPTTCPGCRNKVLTTLDEFRAESTSEAMEKLQRLECECKRAWEKELGTPTEPLARRVFSTYRLVAKEMGFMDWWKVNNSILAAEMSIQ